MKSHGKKNRILLCLLFFFLFSMPVSAAEPEVGPEKILEKSGASGMYDSLEEETKGWLSRAGVDSPQTKGELPLEALFEAVSQMLREKISAPVKAAAALIAILILCRVSNCFELFSLGEASALVGAAACAGVLVPPMLQLITSTELVLQNASVFLLASVPVYSALMVASGDVITGSSYGLLTLTAANSIPILASSLLLPLLNIFLGLALAAAISETNFQEFIGQIYRFAKWALILLVTLFSGVLSVQTVINIQADSAGGKAAKLLASSAIPIVGGAFGDALATIKSSIDVVKSGVGAFGMLAAAFIFLPLILETACWMGVCVVGEMAAQLLEVSKMRKFFSACTAVTKMIMAIVVSTASVSVVCAAVVLFLKGNI